MKRGGGSEIGSEAQRALGELRGPVVQACRAGGEWPAKVATAIQALVEFVATNPRGTDAVALLAPGGEDDAGGAYREAVDHFASLLDQVAPAPARTPASNRGAVVGIAAIVAEHVRSGRVEGLKEIEPELVQYALLPYLSLAEAKRWAQGEEIGMQASEKDEW